MNSIAQKDVARFWGKVDKEISDNFYKNERCWIWVAGCMPSGYGGISISGKTERVHRVAWEIANGKIPDNLHVLHHCDNPTCVNPIYLWLGTHQDNMDDKKNKGRGNSPTGDRHGFHLHPEKWARGEKHGAYTHPEKLVRGENHGMAKLNFSKVREIRRRYRWHGIGGDNLSTLAKEFEVSIQTILDIVKNKSWKE